MKEYGAVGLALLASVTIWLTSNLSREADALVSMPVSIHSTLVGYSDVAMESFQVTANVSGSGFTLLALQIGRHKTVALDVAGQELKMTGRELFEISSNALLSRGNEIFGKKVKVNWFTSDRYSVRFQEESYKRVPVIPVTSIRYKDQYMAKEVRIMPDSVDVYGDPSSVAAVDKVLTSLISARDVDSHGIHQQKVPLQAPAGLRLSSSTVSYNVEVTRFVEVSGMVNVGVRNVPEGKELSVFPSTVQLTARYIFPVSNSSESIAEIYVDYADFAASKGGRCVVKADGIPATLLDWKVSPEVCECFETVSR